MLYMDLNIMRISCLCVRNNKKNISNVSRINLNSYGKRRKCFINSIFLIVDIITSHLHKIYTYNWYGMSLCLDFDKFDISYG